MAVPFATEHPAGVDEAVVDGAKVIPTLTVVMAVHPLASVTRTVYVPPASPVAV